MLTLTTDDGTVVELSDGESHDGLRASSMPGGYYLANESGSLRYFSRIEVDGAEVPDDPEHLRISRYADRSSDFHYLRPGEWLPIFTADIPQPPAEWRIKCWGYIAAMIHAQSAKPEEMQNLIDIHGDDCDDDDNATGNDRDLGWLIRNDVPRGWTTRPSTGWQEPYVSRDQAGINNLSYDALLWMALAYIRKPTDRNWRQLWRCAVMRACTGLERTGSEWGMDRYSKGAAAAGEGFRSGWSKQWLAGLAVACFLTHGHPVLDSAYRMRLARLTAQSPTWYEFRWGVRSWRYYMQDLYVAFAISRDSIILDRAEAALRHLVSGIDANAGYWLQRSGYTTPWMQGGACSWALRWIHEPHLHDRVRDLQPTVEQAGRTILDVGTVLDRGLLLTKYRLAPTEEGPQYLTSTAHMLGLIDRVGTAEEQEAAERTVIDFAARGATFAQAFEGKAPDPHEVGIDFPQQGSGWRKACGIILQGALWR